MNVLLRCKNRLYGFMGSVFTLMSPSKKALQNTSNDISIIVRVEMLFGIKSYDEIKLSIDKDKTCLDLKKKLIEYYGSTVVTMENIILKLDMNDMNEITNDMILETIPDNSKIICEIYGIHDDNALISCFLPSLHKEIRLHDEAIRNIRNEVNLKAVTLAAVIVVGIVGSRALSIGGIASSSVVSNLRRFAFKIISPMKSLRNNKQQQP